MGCSIIGTGAPIRLVVSRNVLISYTIHCSSPACNPLPNLQASSSRHVTGKDVHHAHIAQHF